MDSDSLLIGLVSLLAGYSLREIWYWIRNALEKRERSKSISDDLIYPLVRVSDELVGRTYHHAQKDFQGNAGRQSDVARIKNHDHLYDLYLWTRFWAHTTRVRKNILAYELSKSGSGRNLLIFLDCLEANKISIVPRSYQKFLGDGFADEFGWEEGGSYYRFVKKVKEDRFFAAALEGMNRLFVDAYRHKPSRKELVKYTIIIHAMIDYFDEKRKVSSERRAQSNKLDESGRKDLRLRILGQYTPLDKEKIRKYAG